MNDGLFCAGEGDDVCINKKETDETMDFGTQCTSIRSTNQSYVFFRHCSEGNERDTSSGGGEDRSVDIGTHRSVFAEQKLQLGFLPTFFGRKREALLVRRGSRKTYDERGRARTGLFARQVIIHGFLPTMVRKET